MIDTNIKGLLYVTRAIVPGMVERKSGHVINIGSTAGHEAYPKGHVYCATKHAVNGITKALRMDVIDKNIRVSTVDPGAVETNFSNVRFFGDKEKAKSMYKGITPLVAEDVAEAVLFCATRPPHADFAEWKFGRRATGIVFSAATFGQKFGWGIGGALTGWLLALFNYVPNVQQNSETILGIKLMLSIIPGTLMILSVILLFFYTLTEPFMEKVQKELSERRLAYE